MELKGVIQSAELAETPTGGNEVELQIVVQGVKPGQPRRLVIPFAMLLRDETIEPEALQGHGFAAQVVEESPGRWVVHQLALGPGRVLRRED